MSDFPDGPGSYDLPSVDAITVGTVGPPGQRIFYIQVRQTGTVLSFKLEKAQVAALAQALAEVMADMPPPGPLPDDLALVEPVDAEWVVGPLGLSEFDESTSRLLLQLEELVPEGGDDSSGPVSGTTARVARFGVTAEQMAGMVGRALALLEAGRPNCPDCGFPMDPNGHACPKSNGHLKR